MVEKNRRLTLKEMTNQGVFVMPNTLGFLGDYFNMYFELQKTELSLSDKIIIKVNNASLSNYADTGSMNPVFDIGANGIRIKPESEEQINVGDIVSFDYDNKLIVHRVIEKSFDDKGVYFITKGDNADFPDGKIRFEQIKYITVGVIW